MTDQRRIPRVGALIVVIGLVVTASSFTPIATSGFWFLGAALA